MQIQDLANFAAIGSHEAMAMLVGLMEQSNPQFPFVLTMLETAEGQFRQIPTAASGVTVPTYKLSETGLIGELLTPILGPTTKYEIMRGRSVIGHFFAKTDDFNKFDMMPLGLLSFIYNRKQYEFFVDAFNTPVPFNVGYQQFFKHLRNLAKSAASSTHGAYRSLNGSHLDCLFHWGFDKHINSGKQLSLDINIVPIFKDTVQMNRVNTCWDLKEECPELVSLQSFQSDVQSFCALPVEVGEKVVGLLTIGSSQKYEFSTAEENSFRCISNGIGVSISNYKNHWRGKKFQDEFEEIASSLNALEVVHQIKHNIIDNGGAALTRLDLMKFKVPKSGMSTAEKTSTLESIEIAKKQISKVNDDIRYIGEAISFDRMLEYVSIKDIWDEVRDHLAHRIKDLGVTVHSIAKERERTVISGAVKHIFQNLMLNSLDAFEMSSRSNKEIKLRWLSTGSKTKRWRLQYSDNGPGLPVDILKQQIKEASSHPLSDVDPDITVGEFIFLPKISTKPEGTGQGLFLSRNMAAQHLGGIEFNNRGDGGVSFDIEICFDLQSVFEAARRPIFYRDSKGYKQQLVNIDTYSSEMDKIRRNRSK